jgi:hypothetical protein
LERIEEPIAVPATEFFKKPNAEEAVERAVAAAAAAASFACSKAAVKLQYSSSKAALYREL